MAAHSHTGTFIYAIPPVSAQQQLAGGLFRRWIRPTVPGAPKDRRADDTAAKEYSPPRRIHLS
ncbi:hypothetical protein GCM10022380_49300 [Amycolatopsis tucumanensis]|uniref:Uncharacterized protein n=1 Tax=Amycolatopsis tucumanensis TaxID=401106 RepID=A0ABP7IR27_9PSEU